MIYSHLYEAESRGSLGACKNQITAKKTANERLTATVWIHSWVSFSSGSLAKSLDWRRHSFAKSSRRVSGT